MKKYELVALLHPDLEIDLEKPLNKIEKIISSAGGSILKQDNWGKRRLAYPIAKLDFAVYIYFEVELPADKINEVDKALNITDEVLRHLITVYEERPVVDDEKNKSEDAKTAEEK
jgi:small subunit ribosomal protein S6